MTASEVEQWAIREVRRSPLQESDRVEFKSKIIEPFRFARQIAGHANAARGEWILWILGVDDKLGLVGIPGLEWAKLWQQITSFFDGNPPTPIIVPFQEDGKSLTAVAFETTLPPYVVKESGHDRLEVPWREGTRTRSARHSDLLLLLSATTSLPDFEIVKAGWARINQTTYHFEANLYFIPKSRSRVVIPIHRIKRSISINDIDVSNEVVSKWSGGALVLTPLKLGLLTNEGATVPASCDDYQIILDGPAMILLTTQLGVPPSHLFSQPRAIQSITLALRCLVNFEPLPLEILLRSVL